MDVIVQIIASGLTLGAMYAVSTIGLSLVYGSLNMLNMAHGALLALGGYVCLYVMSTLGLPAIAGLVAAIVVCGLVGLLVYATTAAPMLGGMVTAPLLTQGIKVDLPRAAAQPIAPAKSRNEQPLVLSIDRDGRWYLNVGREPGQADAHGSTNL